MSVWLRWVGDHILCIIFSFWMKVFFLEIWGLIIDIFWRICACYWCMSKYGMPSDWCTLDFTWLIFVMTLGPTQFIRNQNFLLGVTVWLRCLTSPQFLKLLVALHQSKCNWFELHYRLVLWAWCMGSQKSCRKRYICLRGLTQVDSMKVWSTSNVLHS